MKMKWKTPQKKMILCVKIAVMHFVKIVKNAHFANLKHHRPNLKHHPPHLEHHPPSAKNA